MGGFAVKKLCLFILICSILLCGCDAGYSRTSAGASDFYDALAVVQTGVPYYEGINLRLDYIHLLETDAYGRRLFSYHMSLGQTEVLLIVQKTQEPWVYYYEDYCYLLKEGSDAFTAEETNWLKEQNDWDQPTFSENMRGVHFKQTPPDHENIEDYQSVCQQIAADLQRHYPAKNWETAKISVAGLETFQGYGQVILAGVYFADSEATQGYVMLYDGTVVAAEPIDSDHDLRQSIIDFKDMYCGRNARG